MYAQLKEWVRGSGYDV